MVKSKTFRLPVDIVKSLEEFSLSSGKPQTMIVEEALLEKLRFFKEWESDLNLIKEDLEYKNESELMAEEIYE